MNEPGEGFDEETVQQSEPRGAAPRGPRRAPIAQWTDARGTHQATIGSRVVIGSGAGVDLIVADPTVSRLHAELEPDDAGVWVRDLGSRNGTYVGELFVSAVRLTRDATIRLGNSQLTLRFAPVAAARPEEPSSLWPGERFGPLVGRSVAARELFARLARVAPLDAAVLLQGETGTGKELVARALHEASPRAGRPFVIVDCAALPEQLLEAELFGHTKGAFTGAVAARAGAIESAEGGTVFLDEIGEVPLPMQPKLLRVLESRTVRRLGETRQRDVDVRFISATHRDLRRMVNEGAFREDLYFRLAVVPVAIPPLRARPDDVPALIEHFLARRGGGALPPELVRELAGRPWIGNVRELRNFVERAVALGADEALAMATHEQQPPARGAPGVAAHGGAGGDDAVAAEMLGLPFKEAREEWNDRFERLYIRGLLARHHRNVTAVAQAAGVDRSYVHRLIRKHLL